MTRSLKPYRDPPTSPPHLIDDGYYVDPEPVNERPTPPYMRQRSLARGRRAGCSVLPWLVLAVAVWRVGL